MDILVVQHANSGPAGALGDTLGKCGARLDVCDIEGGDRLPASAGNHAALVVLGGLMSALDDAEYPHLGAAADLIAGFHAQAKPVLGICLGAQLIARALGGRVHLGAASELGFVSLALTETAATDPLIGGLSSPQWLMQWHDDTFDLPPGARLLMTGDDCRNQAFRVGEATYAFQCHFEVTRALAGRWLAESRAAGHHQTHPGFHARIDGEIDRHIDGALEFCRTVGMRWAGLVAKSDAVAQSM